MTVTCKLTVDNQIHGVYYQEGSTETWRPLKVSGKLGKWESKKDITFKTGTDGHGRLKVMGEDKGRKEKDHCTWAGLLLHCFASDVNSPWHNFTSDLEHWRAEDNSKLCANNKGMVRASKPKSIVRDLVNAGAVKIWTSKKKATLIGSPSSWQSWQLCSGA